MTPELVPELHDIGKLVDWAALLTKAQRKPYQHSHSPAAAECLGLELPNTLTFLGAAFHHLSRQSTLSARPKGLDQLPISDAALIWLLTVADHLASSVSRSLYDKFEKKELGLDKRETRWPEARRACQRLWQPVSDREADPPLPIRDAAGLGRLIQFLSSDPDWESAKREYPQLAQVPEDKGFPRHVTTLPTHCELVGKFYRVLKHHCVNDDEKKPLVYNRVAAATVDEIEEKWVFRLVHCRIHFPQRPARARDLGVFPCLEDALHAVETCSHTKDYLLLRTLDTAWLFLPTEDIKPLDAALQPLLSRGFYVLADVIEGPVGGLSSDAASLWRRREKLKDAELKERIERLEEPYVLSAYSRSKAHPESFPPPLCELCQLAPGNKPHLDQDSGIVEHLCETCSEIRREPRHQLRKLGDQWEKQDAAVAWVRVRLDYGVLQLLLPQLFLRYIDHCVEKLQPSGRLDVGARQQLAENLRATALLVDFTADYRRFLEEFTEAAKGVFGDRMEQITDRIREVAVIRVDSGDDALQLADLFAAKVAAAFPQCVDDSPIKLAISISNAKYPFFEHWHYLEMPRQAISIRIVGRGLPLELAVRRFSQLRALGLGEERAASALRKAAAIQARSGSRLLAELDLLGNLPKGSALHRAVLAGFSSAQLLAYQTVTDWRSSQ